MEKCLSFLTGFLMAAVVAVAPSSTVMARLSEERMSEFAISGIYYYDPSDSCVSFRYATGAESFGALSATQVAFVETYHNVAVMNSINYGIPWEAVMAQGILESAAGTSNFAVQRNNFFGIGAFDSNPGAAFTYDTPEEGWEGYYKNIQKTATYREHGVFSGETVTDPYAYVIAVKEAGYATDPNYVAKLSVIIAAIEELADAQGWASSAELVGQHPEWYENAEANSQGATIDVASRGMSVCNGGGLVSGGMTLEEAQEFMTAYANEASEPWRRGNLYFDGAYIQDSGCPNGTLNNCSAFTQWFLNRYTTVGPEGAVIHQGSQAVARYLSEIPGLTDGGKTPRVYAIVSMGPYSGAADGWSNHTGIVLGIDEAKNQIIIGEASCGATGGGRSFAPGAHVYNLSDYTENSSPYGPTYAYTDNILKGI